MSNSLFTRCWRMNNMKCQQISLLMLTLLLQKYVNKLEQIDIQIIRKRRFIISF